MEREELLQQVNESIQADGKQLSPSLSEESINGELDDALEDITEDEENNKKVVSRLAKRLLRMDGNIHSNVSREVSDYKKAHPKDAKKPKDGEGGKDGDDTKSEYQKLLERIEKMEEAQRKKEEQSAKDATVAEVTNAFKAKYKNAGLDINSYIFRQTLRDFEIPVSEDGKSPSVSELSKNLEREYIKNLKEAGLDKKDTSKPRFGSRDGAKGESAADRFFAKKGKKEGWKK